MIIKILPGDWKSHGKSLVKRMWTRNPQTSFLGDLCTENPSASPQYRGWCGCKIESRCFTFSFNPYEDLTHFLTKERLLHWTLICILSKQTFTPEEDRKCVANSESQSQFTGHFLSERDANYSPTAHVKQSSCSAVWFSWPCPHPPLQTARLFCVPLVVWRVYCPLRRSGSALKLSEPLQTRVKGTSCK